MTTLRKLQQDFQRFLLTSQASAYPYITGPNKNFIAERLAIYSDAYQLRLQEVLATHFPGLYALVGEQLFEKLTQDYLAAFPSTYVNARYFGEGLTSFLLSHASYKTKPELAKMAAFEWAVGLAEDAADAELLAQTDLAEIPEAAWPDLCFKLHPSVQFIELEYNIPEIWQAVQIEQPLPPLIKSTPEKWTIWRYDLVVHYHRHSNLELTFLQSVAENKNFAEICEVLSNSMPIQETAQQAVGMLITFLNNQMFIK